MSATHRARPLPVEARQVQGSGDGMTGRDLALWCNGWVSSTWHQPKVGFDTEDGPVIARTGDWIIRNHAGRFRVVRAEVFAEAYEPVPATEAGGRYAADVECAIGLNISTGAAGVYAARDAVLAVRDREMEQLRTELASLRTTGGPS